jgi:hypothetical protein
MRSGTRDQFADRLPAVTFDDDAVARLHEAVLTWFDRQARAFEFRGICDPYAILVSEVILQQTQASRGELAWRAFMERFPTVEALAARSPRPAPVVGPGLQPTSTQPAARSRDCRAPEAGAGRRGTLRLWRDFTARAVASPSGVSESTPTRTRSRSCGRGYGSARSRRALAAALLQARADAAVPWPSG